MKRFSSKYRIKIFENSILSEDMHDMFINFFNANNFTDSRRFCEYLSSLKNLDNWDTNYIEFDKYAAKVKSSTAGLYDPEYIRLKYNVCLLESNKIISAKKSNKATNLKGFIARHGEVKGKELYEKFQKSSISGSKIKSTNMSDAEDRVGVKSFMNLKDIMKKLLLRWQKNLINLMPEQINIIGYAKDIMLKR